MLSLYRFGMQWSGQSPDLKLFINLLLCLLRELLNMKLNCLHPTMEDSHEIMYENLPQTPELDNVLLCHRKSRATLSRR